LAKINFHKTSKSSVYSIDHKVASQNFSTKGSVAGKAMTYVNPEKKRGDNFIRNLQQNNQRNQINELYWEFQNKEIKQYEVQKFNEKMLQKQETLTKTF
jgi:hypothetical protein